MFTQLNPYIPLYVVDRKTTGQAIGVIDYSKDDDLLWVIILDDTGEIWCVNNRNVRGVKNYSFGRE
jgi:hypothetical protein